MNIGTDTKVEIGLLTGVIAGIVWLLAQVLPVDARIQRTEQRVSTLEGKVDTILENTNYIKGKLDSREGQNANR